jgi:hypothetical protein
VRRKFALKRIRDAKDPPRAKDNCNVLDVTKKKKTLFTENVPWKPCQPLAVGETLGPPSDQTQLKKWIQFRGINGSYREKSDQLMTSFEPPISFGGQGLVFLVIAAIAFVSVVAFFLYENLNKRSLVVEVGLALMAAWTLGTAIFFGLVRADVIL